MQHDDKDEDSIHAIVLANVHETKPDKENEKPLEAGRNQTKPAEGEDEGDDEAAGGRSMVANLILRHERWRDGGDGALLQG